MVERNNKIYSYKQKNNRYSDCFLIVEWSSLVEDVRTIMMEEKVYFDEFYTPDLQLD